MMASHKQLAIKVALDERKLFPVLRHIMGIKAGDSCAEVNKESTLYTSAPRLWVLPSPPGAEQLFTFR